MLANDIIRIKRDGGRLQRAHIDSFARGLADGSWSDAQAAALAMAVLIRGMSREETVWLTAAMTASGDTLRWDDAALHGPVVDKHSTGGVGDKVSLMLAPIAAACGAVVPMISGRGLGHTGGTLDKLEALPGYTVLQPRNTIVRTLQDVGCAIVGASDTLAPADKRLYAIRDVTATVESVPLITASILSKKLAAGLQSLVLDVKTGSGAFCATLDEARALATSLVQVAQGAGLPAVALLTDMQQVLGWTAGNALEVQEALAYLAGTRREPRLHAVTLALAAQMLVLSGLALDLNDARGRAQRALDSGEAAERFARMVAALGGPRDVFAEPGLAAAPVQRDVPAPRAGVLLAMDVRAVGQAVVALGGGRQRPGETIDPRVGLSAVLALGSRVAAGDALACVHAASADAADAAVRALQAALQIGDGAAAAGTATDVVLEVIGAGDADA